MEKLMEKANGEEPPEVMKKNGRICSIVTILIAFAICSLGIRDVIYAATFTVNSADDAADTNPGDGNCETALGIGSCTLRAAIQESNALPGSQVNLLMPGPYVLKLGLLQITNSLFING